MTGNGESIFKNWLTRSLSRSKRSGASGSPIRPTKSSLTFPSASAGDEIRAAYCPGCIPKINLVTSVNLEKEITFPETGRGQFE